MITFSAVRPEEIPALALRLSREDLVELERRGCSSTVEAIQVSVAASHEAFMASWDGEVQAVFGVIEWPEESSDSTQRVGIPWLLCATPPPCVQMTFMRMAEEVVARWSRTFAVLRSAVDAERTRARRWLVSLGLKPTVVQEHSGFSVIKFEATTL